MNNLIKNKIVFFTIMSIIFIGFIEVKTVNAVNITNNPSKNADVVEYLNTSNNILIIGDSRICQMYKAVGNASYVAMWGGHYYGNDVSSINGPSRKATIKKYINEIVNKHGKCIVIIEATINDYTGTDLYNGHMNDAVRIFTNFATEVANYNKNVTVYTTNLIGMEKKYGTGIHNYNVKLEELAKNSNKYKYIYVKPSTVDYTSDGLHFNKSTLTYIYNRIKTVVPTSKKLIVDVAPTISKIIENNNLILTVKDSSGIDAKDILIKKRYNNVWIGITNPNVIQYKVTKKESNKNVSYEYIIKPKTIDKGVNQFYFNILDKNGHRITEKFYVNKLDGKYATNSAPNFRNWNLENDSTVKFTVNNGGNIKNLKVYDLNNNEKQITEKNNIASKSTIQINIGNLKQKNGKYNIKIYAVDLQSQVSNETVSFSVK